MLGVVGPLLVLLQRRLQVLLEAWLLLGLWHVVLLRLCEGLYQLLLLLWVEKLRCTPLLPGCPSTYEQELYQGLPCHHCRATLHLHLS
jgi:hypothetical protein